MPERIPNVLKQTDAFNSLEEDELSRIIEFSEMARAENGQRLFKEGAKATDLWVIISGKVDLRFEMPARETTQAHTISTVSSPAIIGWSSLIPPYQYKLSAYCTSEACELARVNGEQLVAYLKQNPQIGYRVLREMIQVVGKRFEHLQATADAAPLSAS